MHDALPVGPSIIGGGLHRGKIIFRLRTFEGSACKLLIGESDVVFGGGLFHYLKKIRADLMAEAARTRMYHYGHLISKEPQRICCFLIVYLIDVLDFEEVIARAEGPLLGPSSF